MALTRRQREIYDFIRKFVAGQGYSPSLEEIGERFELSSVAWNRSRSVEPVEADAPDAVALPLLGVVAAGQPIESIEVPESIDVPRELVPRQGESYVLRVRGDSMIDEQIRDGDYVVIESRSHARNGETVVALLRGEETTLKKLQRRGRKVVLQPANAEMQPIEVPAAQVQIQGVVRGLLRRYYPPASRELPSEQLH